MKSGKFCHLYLLNFCSKTRDFLGVDHFIAILQHPPVPIRQRDASIPKALADVIDLALIDNPDLHFKTAKEFQQALLSIVN